MKFELHLNRKPCMWKKSLMLWRINWNRIAWNYHHFALFRMKNTRKNSTSSSSSDSDSDDEMRSRLLAACVSAEMIKESSKKMSKIKDKIIKVVLVDSKVFSCLNLGRAIWRYRAEPAAIQTSRGTSARAERADVWLPRTKEENEQEASRAGSIVWWVSQPTYE